MIAEIIENLKEVLGYTYEHWGFDYLKEVIQVVIDSVSSNGVTNPLAYPLCIAIGLIFAYWQVVLGIVSAIVEPIFG